LIRRIFSACTAREMTPHDGQPCSPATPTTTTSRTPSSTKLTDTTRRPSRPYNSVVACSMLVAPRLGDSDTNHPAGPRASQDHDAPITLNREEPLSDKQWARLKRLLQAEDPTGQIAAAWAVKEALRQLLDAMPATRGPLVTDRRRDARQITGADLARLRPYELRPRLQRFYEAAAAADLPEATRLATTVQTWWPAVEAFLRLRVTNARFEG